MDEALEEEAGQHAEDVAEDHEGQGPDGGADAGAGQDVELDSERGPDQVGWTPSARRRRWEVTWLAWAGV